MEYMNRVDNTLKENSKKAVISIGARKRGIAFKMFTSPTVSNMSFDLVLSLKRSVPCFNMH